MSFVLIRTVLLFVVTHKSVIGFAIMDASAKESFDEVMMSFMWSVWLLWWHIKIPFVDKKGEVNTVIA